MTQMYSMSSWIELPKLNFRKEKSRQVNGNLLTPDF